MGEDCERGCLLFVASVDMSDICLIFMASVRCTLQRATSMSELQKKESRRRASKIAAAGEAAAGTAEDLRA
jgi:hypothetical protein